MRFILLLIFFSLLIRTNAQTVGWFYNEDGSLPGYVLFAPNPSDTTYLIDKCGKKVHKWHSTYHPGLAVYLLKDGTLLRCGSTDNNHFDAGGSGGIIEKFDWESNLLWSYQISSNSECQHHDAIQLPNGNVLTIAWEAYTKAEAIAQGRNPTGLGNEVWSDKLIEIQPIGDDSGVIVWEWHAWDHLIQDYDSTQSNYGVVGDHPELINVNLGTLNNLTSDWLHCNSLDYDSTLDQILISSHNLSEVWIIDHSTTSVEAASHIGGLAGKGGDLLYRWGNPQNYDRGTSDDRKLYQQHNASWIRPGLPGAGKILVFNNGVNRPGGQYSTVETFTTPVAVDYNYPIIDSIAYEPAAQDWIYAATPTSSFFTQTMGGAQRLSNGNTLICEANEGRLFEIDSNGMNLWKYVSPVALSGIVTQGTNPFGNSTFRCTYLSFDYPGLAGQSLVPGAPIEKNPLNYSCENYPVNVSEVPSENNLVAVYPNPFHDQFAIYLPGELKNAHLFIHDALGQLIYEESNFSLPSFSLHNITLVNRPGIMFITLVNDGGKILWHQPIISQ